MRDGKKGIHPGIRPDGKDWFVVRVTVRNPTEGTQREREKRVQGTLSDAIREREDLKEVLRCELENEAK